MIVFLQSEQILALMSPRVSIVALALLTSSPVVAQAVPANRETGVFSSPDGRFCVEVYHGLGDCNYLQVYPGNRPPDGNDRHEGLLRFPQADVWGVVWVPGHPHFLLFGEAGITGKLSLEAWTGGLRCKPIVHAPDADERFELTSVSADGKTAFYDDVVNSVPPRVTHRRTRLP